MSLAGFITSKNDSLTETEPGHWLGETLYNLLITESTWMYVRAFEL